MRSDHSPKEELCATGLAGKGRLTVKNAHIVLNAPMLKEVGNGG